jgi:signal peptidase I
MEHTLEVGDFLLISKAAYGAVIPGTERRLPGYADPRRGDVIVFRAAHEPNMDLVKRLIGLPGDTVAMRGGVLYLNGVAQVESYLKGTPGAQDASHPAFAWQREFVIEEVADGAYRPTLHNWGPLVVPPGRYFALGDNREQSLDSRFWGFVDAAKVKGRAVFLYWSYDGEVLRPFPWLTAVRWERIGDRIR